MSEMLIKQLNAFPTNAPSSKELWALFPQRLQQLTEEQAEYLTQIITESMDSLSEIIVEQMDHNCTSLAMHRDLATPFLFAFGKGVEIVYKMITDSDEPVEFDIDNAADGTDAQIPE